MEINPFYFYTSSNLVELTGEKADNLEELVALLKRCTGSAIFYHVFQSYRDRHFVIEQYHSDFAQWISTSLNEEPLAERLGSLDIRDFTSIRSLRESTIKIIEEYAYKYPQSKNRQGKTPFFFCQSVSVVMPTHYIAWNLEDFYQVIGKIGIRSIHYHLIEARLRLGIHTNDFSYWFRDSLKKEKLAHRIEGIDIYLHTLEEIRKKILHHIEEEMKA
ncbi:MAG: hypothetical protein COZ69_02090 [Deltaproteobacteria bacterium CG_4_8_14_3_um_filter_45_9]|nr:MAG: hypothetical protein COZ69_02090 [Deltaproteobacteria bacterium CG_4_8_14_3_um_filter_45_9]